MAKRLAAGKLPRSFLASLLERYASPAAGVVLGPRIGEDAAVIEMADRYLVAGLLLLAAAATPWFDADSHATMPRPSRETSPDGVPEAVKEARTRREAGDYRGALAGLDQALRTAIEQPVRSCDALRRQRRVQREPACRRRGVLRVCQ